MWQKIKHLLVAPWKWCWENLKDWRTAVIFAVVFLVLSSEVWGCYLVGWLAMKAGNTTLGGTLIGVASTCWVFWLGPATPFLPLCIGLTAGIKAIINKIFHLDNTKQEKEKNSVINGTNIINGTDTLPNKNAAKIDRGVKMAAHRKRRLKKRYSY